MTKDDIDVIGKKVKDMYGTFMGKVAGTITDIDGSIQTVGIDTGSMGLQQIPFEQLVVQQEVVIFIPKWRLDSQRLIHEKQLTLRRLKALLEIVSENDDIKSDAEIIHEKYRSKLATLNETERSIKDKLDVRLAELDEQIKSAKMLVFDARVQFKSNEISDTVFETVSSCTNEIIEHIDHEIAEIKNVKQRIADLELEAQELTPSVESTQHIETDPRQTVLPEAPTEAETLAMSESKIPEPPTEYAIPFPEPPKQEVAKNDGSSDWLKRMEAQ